MSSLFILLLNFEQEMNAVHTRLRFMRHFYQLLLKFSRKESKEPPPNININSLIEEILKSTHTCREALNSSLSTLHLGTGYGEAIIYQRILRIMQDSRVHVGY